MLQVLLGFVKAIELAYKNIDGYNSKLTMLREYCIKQVGTKFPNVILNGDRVDRLPGNVNFSFKDVNGGDLLLELDEMGICASTGSACNSGSNLPSHVLTAIGLEPEYLQGSLRLTFGDENTKEDIDFFVNALNEILNK